MPALATYLASYKKSRINLSEIESLYSDYSSLVHAVNQAVAEGLLAPVRNSGLNGRMPPLFARYHIIVDEQVYANTISLIQRLPLGLDSRYYLAHPRDFQEQYPAIQAFAEFWQNRRQLLSVPVAINERSYQIFAQEKFLAGPGRQIAANLGVAIERLNCYETPEPFFFVPKTSSENNVLIIENKDTFHTLRRLPEGRFLGVSYAYLIYGEGKKILQSHLFLDEIADNVDTAYYFGDIDLEGINIFLSLQKLIRHKLAPHVKAYVKTLRLARKPYQSGVYHPVDIEPFLAYFCLPAARRLRQLLTSGQRIPQEALSNYHIRAFQKHASVISGGC